MKIRLGSIRVKTVGAVRGQRRASHNLALRVENKSMAVYYYFHRREIVRLRDYLSEVLRETRRRGTFKRTQPFDRDGGKS